VLAQAGLGSRRACEEYILQGRVTVDGKTVKELGARVHADRVAIAVDGEKLKAERHVYYAVNKPKGHVSTNDDPAGRPRVVDLLPEVPERVYTVGRLDEESTGLMILTNDGELANKLAHPRYGVEKIYRAVVAGSPAPEVIARLTEGVWLSDGKVRAKRARVVGSQGEATVLELVLAEGKKREIRRMLAKFGHKVMLLTRIAIGPITLKGIPMGDARPLTRTEVDMLRKVASGIAISPPRDLSRDARPHGRGPRQGQGQGQGYGQEQGQGQGQRYGQGQARGQRPSGPGRGAPAGPPRFAEGRDQGGARHEIDIEALGPPPSQRRGQPPQGRPEESRRSRPERSPSGVRPPRQHFEDGSGPPPRPAGPGRPGQRPPGGPPPRPSGPQAPRGGGQGYRPEGGPPPRPPAPRGGGQGYRPAGGPPPRPAGPPPSQRPRPAGAGRPQGPGPRPPAPDRAPRPAGPPPSRREPQGPPPVPMAKGRRIIGLDAVHREVAAPSTPSGPSKRPMPRRKPPRKAAGVKRKRSGEES
jgi:23S rRNA pseudouridine2605 synthase